jgi:hypothetical protein
MFEVAEDAQVAAVPFPLRERDGTNPIERKAVYRAQLEIGSMPASLVVQIALWPDKLADWAKESGIAPAVVYNMLAGVKPYHRVRSLLARRLNVPKSVLDYLVDAPRPEPLAKVPPDPPAAVEAATPSPSPPSSPSATASEAERAASSVTDPTAAVPGGRLERWRRRSPSVPPASQIALNL